MISKHRFNLSKMRFTDSMFIKYIHTNKSKSKTQKKSAKKDKASGLFKVLYFEEKIHNYATYLYTLCQSFIHRLCSKVNY